MGRTALNATVVRHNGLLVLPSNDLVGIVVEFNQEETMPAASFYDVGTLRLRRP